MQLFPRPQQHVASKTRSEPDENLKLSVPSKERMMLESVMSPIASQRRVLMLSLKRKRAISEVATISKFPNREALAAEPVLNAQHQKYRCGNVQNDHAQNIGKITSVKFIIRTLSH